MSNDAHWSSLASGGATTHPQLCPLGSCWKFIILCYIFPLLCLFIPCYVAGGLCESTIDIELEALEALFVLLMNKQSLHIHGVPIYNFYP